jgi:hypothetical protein
MRAFWCTVTLAASLAFVAQAGAATITLSGNQRAPVAGGRIELQANEWRGTSPFTIRSDGGPDFTITRSAINQYQVGAYPSLFVGRHGDFVTRRDPLPLQLATIRRGEVKVSVRSVTPSAASSGRWVDILDVFLTADPNVSQFSTTRREEMVIWQNGANRGPGLPTLVAKGVSFCGRRYNVYNVIPSQDTISYIPQTYNPQVYNPQARTDNLVKCDLH